MDMQKVEAVATQTKTWAHLTDTMNEFKRDAEAAGKDVDAQFMSWMRQMRLLLTIRDEDTVQGALADEWSAEA
jgi:hypothetical protein